MHSQLHAKYQYFSHAIALDGDAQAVPDSLVDYSVDRSEIDLFLSGGWLDMDPVNKGFLPLRARGCTTRYS